MQLNCCLNDLEAADYGELVSTNIAYKCVGSAIKDMNTKKCQFWNKLHFFASATKIPYIELYRYLLESLFTLISVTIFTCQFPI